MFVSNGASQKMNGFGQPVFQTQSEQSIKIIGRKIIGRNIGGRKMGW